MTIISFKDVSFGFNDNLLFSNADFNIQKNSFCVVLGRSGAGKSTILYLIAGIENLYKNKKEKNKGIIHINENIVENQKIFINPENRRIAFVFQTPSLFPHKNIYENISFAIKNKSKMQKTEEIHNILKKIKMDHYIDHFPHQLSVGQQQRIAFARALASDAEIILLDEPFSGLDFESKFLLYNLLLEIKLSSHKTIILVTHDFEEAAFFGNDFLILDNQQIYKYNSIEDLYKKPLTRYIASLFQFTNISNSLDELEKYLVTRPEDIKIEKTLDDKNYHDHGTIKEIKFFGSYYIIVIKLKDKLIFAKLDKIADFKIEDRVLINIAKEKILVVDS